jgi:polysaccharide export outer membrane protein
MATVPMVRAFRLPMIAAVAALALSGCMRTVSPVAVAEPQGDLDSLAYGQSYRSAPPAQVADASGGGAINALRNALATSPGGYAPQPAATPAAYAAYAAAPAPVRYDAGYKLDAGAAA